MVEVRLPLTSNLRHGLRIPRLWLCSTTGDLRSLKAASRPQVRFIEPPSLLPKMPYIAGPQHPEPIALLVGKAVPALPINSETDVTVH